MKYTTNYATAIEWLNINLVLCNRISEIDCSIAEKMWDALLNDTEVKEIFQWYITDASASDVEWLSEHFGLKFAYSELLECYILMVDHYGTSWDYVMIETDIKQAERKEGEHK